MKRQTLGILLLVLPIPLFILVLASYAVISFVIVNIITASGGASAAASLIGTVFRLLLSLTGIVAVLGIPFGMPTGIYLLCTPEKKKE